MQSAPAKGIEVIGSLLHLVGDVRQIQKDGSQLMHERSAQRSFAARMATIAVTEVASSKCTLDLEHSWKPGEAAAILNSN